QTLRVAHLKAALADKTDIDIKLPPIPIAPEKLSEIIAVEVQQLKADQDDHDKEKVHLGRMIERYREELASLEQARQEEVREVELLKKDAASARDALQKGIIQSSRVLEQQRALSEAQSRLFDVMARAISARRETELLIRQLQKASDNRRMKL